MSSPPAVDPREGDLVLTELNLPMLFVDLGTIDVLPRPVGDRRLHVRLTLSTPRGIADVESIVGRLLHNELVSRVVVARGDDWGRPELTTSCIVSLARGDWEIVIDLTSDPTLQRR